MRRLCSSRLIESVLFSETAVFAARLGACWHTPRDETDLLRYSGPAQIAVFPLVLVLIESALIVGIGAWERGFVIATGNIRPETGACEHTLYCIDHVIPFELRPSNAGTHCIPV